MKKRFILSFCSLLLFALLAGGSHEIIVPISVILIVPAFAVILVIILSYQAYNEDKRLKMIKQDETTDRDFDRSVSYGNSRCMLYFDSSKKQVMIMRIMTEGIKKTFVDGFEFSGKEFCRQNDRYFCIYDAKNRYLLCGDYKDMNVKLTKKDIAAEDKHKDITPRNSIQAKLTEHTVTQEVINSSTTYEYVYVLVDECHGMIVVVRRGEISSIFNYISGENISKKSGEKSFVNSFSIGNYYFIMDELFNVLVIITPISYELLNYSDILEVSYEENGAQLYSKSAMRTVGGAIVGGALMGEVGSVIGGLSGDTKENREIKTMDIKILLRNTQRPSCVLSFNDSKRTLKTKNSTDNELYEAYKENANKAKDILSVIIDKAKQSISIPIRQEASQSVQQSSLADELTKLAKLKSDGILTEEEFNVQKAKLLNM